MSSLASQLGIDLDSPTQRRAIVLESNDAAFLRDLVAMRRRLGLTQSDVAERLGLSQATVAAFERYDNDPKLSTVRRYAHAIGAVTSHAVVEDNVTEEPDDGWGADTVVRTYLRPRRQPKPHSDWKHAVGQ